MQKSIFTQEMYLLRVSEALTTIDKIAILSAIKRADKLPLVALLAEIETWKIDSWTGIDLKTMFTVSWNRIQPVTASRVVNNNHISQSFVFLMLSINSFFKVLHIEQHILTYNDQ